MKKTLISLLAIFTSAILFAQVTVPSRIDDPNAEVREAKGFHGIHVSNAFDVYLTQSDQEAVAVSANDPKYRDKIVVEVKDGILYVKYDNDWKFNSGNKKLKAYISFKNIDKLSISGACDVYVQGTIKGDDLMINQSGASDLKGKFEVKKLTIDLNGASDMTVSGIVSELNVEVSGASDFKGFDLVADTGDFHASGASDIQVTVNKEFNARASGASDIKYKGDGLIRDLKTSGASSVSRRG